MADYSVGIAKIYQFIKKDIYQMDLDGNGTIIESECKYFLKENINKGNLELDKDEKANDLIAAFWKKINTNKCGKSIVSLDDKEIDEMNRRIQVYEKLDEYLDKVIYPKLKSNKYITDAESQAKWKKSVKDSLFRYVERFIEKGGTADTLEAYFSGQLEDDFYEDPSKKNIAQLAMNKTTANIYAQKYIKEKIGIIGEKFQDLQDLISNLIQNEIGDKELTDEVIAKTKALVDDYVAQASGSYNFTEEAKEEKLSEYMTYVLTQHLTKVMKQIEKDPDYADNKQVYDSAVSSYIEKTVSSAKKGDFNELLKLDYNTIIKSAEFQAIKDQIAKDKLEALRREVISYCNTQYEKREGYRQAVETVFGSQYEDAIKNMEYDELSSKYKELKDLISKIIEVPDKSSSIYNSLPDSVTSGKSKFTFYVDEKGEPIFVIYDEATAESIFGSDTQKNSGLQERFKTVRASLESGYSEQLSKLGFTEQEKANIFNAALFMTLANNSNYYDFQDVAGIMQDLIKNYTSLLKKAAANENARKYITDYDKNSYLAGTTTDLEGGSALTTDFGLGDNQTCDKDDLIELDNGDPVEITVTTSSYSGPILHLTGGDSEDDDVANTVMDNMVKKYVETYCDVIDGNKIFKLFLEAQKIAISKLKAVGDEYNGPNGDPDPDHNQMNGFQVYAYGDYGGYTEKSSKDTYYERYYSIASLMIQIEVEMELLIAKEIMK